MSDYFNIGASRTQVNRLYINSTTSDRTDPSAFKNAEWAQILPDKVIVATEERAWLYQPRSNQDRFSQPKKGAGNVATTQKLLDGAIAAAKTAINSELRPPKLTATRWVWRLAGQYYLAHAYPKLIEKSAIGFAAYGHWHLAKWALEKAKEESGHDRLALLDIKAMGYKPEAVVENLLHPTAVALIDYFTRSAEDDDPIDCVGYSYTMERLATSIEQDYIHKVEARLPSNLYATRCLRVHSNIGEDTKHVEETAKMVAGLTAKERVRVARACYETALLCFSSPSSAGYISNEELQERLEPLKLENS